MVNNRAAIDPRWTRHHSDAAEDFMLATVRIVRKVVSDGPVEYDFETGGYTGAQTIQVYDGKARIQPFGIIGDQIVAQEPTGRRLMRIQLPGFGHGINVDDELIVTSSADNPDLIGFQMEIRGTISSSNAWMTDLVAEANVKKYG